MIDIDGFKCILCGSASGKLIKDYNSVSPYFSGLKVLECISCGHRTAFPCPDLSYGRYYQEDYFDADYESKKHSLLVKQAEVRAEFIAGNVNFKTGKTLRVLDVGAGFGHIGKELSSRFKTNKIIYDAVEVNQIALKYLSLPDNKVRHIFSNWTDAKDFTYDLIVLSHILEHLGDPVSFLKDIYKKLSKHGFIFVEVPNEYSLWKNKQEPHVQFFSQKILGKFLSKSGLHVVKAETYGELIKNWLADKELKNSIARPSYKALRAKHSMEMDGCGGERRWIRSLSSKQKKILFLMLYPVYTRNFEPVIRELAGRGYAIHIIFNDLVKYRKEGVKEAIDLRLKDIAIEYPNVTYDIVNPAPQREFLKNLSRNIRAFYDYTRYLRPEYAFMNGLKERCRKKFFSGFMVFADKWHKCIKSTKGMSCFYFSIEKILGVPGNIKKFISDGKYDAVFVTPLVNIGSEQVDYIKAAKSLKVPCVLTVHSWDNLTNKGLMRILPDRVCVWNGYQVEEALTVHGMPKERVMVTGAQCYDHWFMRSPTLSIKEFSRLAGLPGEEKFILYLGSSRAIAPDEVSFVKKWINAVRGYGNSSISRMPILIRPHPQNAKQWADVEFNEDKVAVYPRSGRQTIDENAKQEYFHSLYYASAVVGINTSAMIESVILKKPVFTILDESFKASQEETYHFRYLKDIGPVYSSCTLSDHINQLSDVLANPYECELKAGKFVAEFIRPEGIDKKATEIFADKINGFLNNI